MFNESHFRFKDDKLECKYSHNRQNKKWKLKQTVEYIA